MLESGKVDGWQLAGICEYPLEKTSNPISRIWQRWFAHPKRVAREINRLVSNNQCDLVHITDQEQGHLMPRNCPVPGIITVHDLFHLFPEHLRFSDEVIAVGDTKPGIVRRRDLQKLKAGINRANHLLCNSKHTLEAAEQHFPTVPASRVPLGIESANITQIITNQSNLIYPTSVIC
ncbi:MAG: hypothetical protein CM15mP2_0970 [Methanobacteriota archaeon]|nr:MAG: hypothetical protein CM15mP2_0970 [Euryarchaeota archaeon]